MDREFALLGGDWLDHDDPVRDLPFPWHADLCTVVLDACSDGLAGGTAFLTLPPLLLTGEKGVGRTHVTRRLAALAGVPHVSLDLSGLDLNSLHGRPAGPDLVLPCPPVMAVAVSGCANPMISVTGVQHADPAVQAWLFAMLDRTRAARWVDHAVGAVVDLSMISWLIQADDIGELPPTLLNALHIVAMRMPGPDETRLHHVNILVEVAHDLGVVDTIDPWVVPEALAAMARMPAPWAHQHGHSARGEVQAGYTARLYATAAAAIARSMDHGA